MQGKGGKGMVATAGMNGRVLAVIKQHGPIRVPEIRLHVAADDKSTRNAIDTLRKWGEPVWLDPGEGFWWRNDRAPSPKPGADRWKRRYEPV